MGGQQQEHSFSEPALSMAALSGKENGWGMFYPARKLRLWKRNAQNESLGAPLFFECVGLGMGYASRTRPAFPYISTLINPTISLSVCRHRKCLHMFELVKVAASSKI